MKRYCPKLVGLSLCLASWPAFADVVWPALFLETRMFTWWSIAIGLLAEFLVVRWLFQLPLKRAAVATFTANLVSALAGVPLIPIAGIAWEFFPASIYMKLFNWGTFNPITWGATFLLACFINTLIEAQVYKRVFKLPVQQREFIWLVFANSLSVGVAFGSLFVVPLET